VPQESAEQVPLEQYCPDGQVHVPPQPLELAPQEPLAGQVEVGAQLHWFDEHVSFG